MSLAAVVRSASCCLMCCTWTAGSPIIVRRWRLVTQVRSRRCVSSRCLADALCRVKCHGVDTGRVE
eukprot:7094865-Alexandrium_andersonii.AAC.1